MKAKFIAVAVCGLALACASMNAQRPMGGGMPPMGGGMRGGMPGGMMMMGGANDMSEIARKQTEILAKTLKLDGKQYKKIYKINLDELDRRMNHMLASGSSTSGRGMGGGMMGGGMPPMGGPGMMGGGMPPMGGMPGMPGMPGMNPDGNAEAAPAEAQDPDALTDSENQVISRLEALERTKADIKAQEKIAKKMQKILTAEQYQIWDMMAVPGDYFAPYRMLMGPRGMGRGPQGRPQGAPQGGPQGMGFGPQGGPQGMQQGGPQGQTN